MKRFTFLFFLFVYCSQGFSLVIPSQSSPANGAVNQKPNEYLFLNTVLDATGYDFEIDLDPSFSTSTIVHRTTRDCPTGDLLFGETYYWRVRAKNDTDTTDWSAPWSFTVRAAVDLSTPIHNAINQDVKIFLSWNSFGGVTQYRYEYDISPDFDSEHLFSATVLHSYSAVYIYRI